MRGALRDPVGRADQRTFVDVLVGYRVRGRFAFAGNALPARWQGRDAFTILETGFGLGNNFLATWAAWRADPRRSRRLRFISIEKHPLRATDLRRALTLRSAR